MRVLRHGSNSTYVNQKCRCERCCEAATRYKKAHRKAANPRGRAAAPKLEPVMAKPENGRNDMDEVANAVWERHLQRMKEFGLRISQTKEGAHVMLGWDWGRSPLEDM